VFVAVDVAILQRIHSSRDSNSQNNSAQRAVGVLAVEHDRIPVIPVVVPVRDAGTRLVVVVIAVVSTKTPEQRRCKI